VVPLAADKPKALHTKLHNTPRREQVSGTVLLIDDDEAVLDSTSLFLGVSGFRVLVASNSQQALELLDKEKPDLVITDYGLAQQETGLDLLRTIRDKLGHHVPAIVITGDISQRNRAGLGANTEIVCKPIDPQLLLQLVWKQF
jgi:DNA-binding response OmpR family regulator